jgi:hypothetical protein
MDNKINENINNDNKDNKDNLKKIVDKIKRQEYNNKFIFKNKEKINNKIICNDCGGSYTYYNKSTHLKTNKHKLFLRVKAQYNI